MKIKRFCKLGIIFAVLCAVLAASAAPASARRGGDAPQARVMLSSTAHRTAKMIPSVHNRLIFIK